MGWWCESCGVEELCVVEGIRWVSNRVMAVVLFLKGIC